MTPEEVWELQFGLLDAAASLDCLMRSTSLSCLHSLICTGGKATLEELRELRLGLLEAAAALVHAAAAPPPPHASSAEDGGEDASHGRTWAHHLTAAVQVRLLPCQECRKCCQP